MSRKREVSFFARLLDSVSHGVEAIRLEGPVLHTEPSDERVHLAEHAVLEAEDGKFTNLAAPPAEQRPLVPDVPRPVLPLPHAPTPTRPAPLRAPRRPARRRRLWGGTDTSRTYEREGSGGTEVAATAAAEGNQ